MLCGVSQSHASRGILSEPFVAHAKFCLCYSQTVLLLVIKVIEVIIQTTIFCREKWMYSAENCVSVAMFYALAL